MTAKYRNILIISLQGIGDLLLATPLMRGIKLAYPDSKIVVLTLETNKEVLKLNSFVDKVIALNLYHKNNPFKIAKLLYMIKKENFDLSICTYPSGLRSAFIAYFSGIRERFGQRLNLFRNYGWLFTKQVPITEVKHAILMNLDFLFLLGIDPKNVGTDPVFCIDDSDTRAAESFLRFNGIESSDPLISIHAGGGKFTAAYRNWPLENFAKVADYLIERVKAKIIFIGGENDIPQIMSAAGMMRGKPVVAAGRLSLKETAAVLGHSRFLICNNSGPMHIAAALHIPTVSIFGSADPRIHRPWGEGHMVIQNQLECAPCYYPFFRDTLEETKIKNSWVSKKFICRNGDYRCLTTVSVDQVIEAVEAALRVI